MRESLSSRDGALAPPRRSVIKLRGEALADAVDPETARIGETLLLPKEGRVEPGSRIPGAAAPKLVKREMISLMKRGAVVVVARPPALHAGGRAGHRPFAAP